MDYSPMRGIGRTGRMSIKRVVRPVCRQACKKGEISGEVFDRQEMKLRR